MDKSKQDILATLPASYQALFSDISFEGLEEIRFRMNRPIMLYRGERASFLGADGCETKQVDDAKTCNRAEIGAIASCLCEHSVYAHQNDIKEGFITIKGGHRAGLSGRGVMKNGILSGLSHISGINLRIARAYKGTAEPLLSAIFKNNQIKNTLLIGPPASGKTTVLRDLCRMLSARFKVSLVDERSEIAASFEGIPAFDIGPQTDVLDRVPKSEGMQMAIRSLSPHILMTDELGKAADFEALRLASASGCRYIASMHGDSLEALAKRHEGLLALFDVAVLMGRRQNRPAILKAEELDRYE